MKNKILIALQCLFLLTGCNNQPKEPSYQIKIVDIDGEILGQKELSYNENTVLFNDLIANFDVEYTTSEFGPYLSRINGSIIDNNYYLAIYQNNEAAPSGVDGIVVKENDVLEFKVECWNTIQSGYGTLDEYDLLVDKAIYGYMKKLDLSKSTSFSDGSFWDLLTINVAKNNYYDSQVFNFDNISEAVKNEIENYDISQLTDANLYKYYLYSKALNKDLTALSEYATAYAATLDSTYNYYVTPFVVAACYGLKVNNEILDGLVKESISNDYTWGPDIPVWQYTTSMLYNENVDASTLTTCVSKLDYENSCSTALVLQAFAASNENIRDAKYEVDGKDLIEVLFDNYYNAETNVLEYTKGVENTYSANQTIASLMAYKAYRDNKKAINIYG